MKSDIIYKIGTAEFRKKYIDPAIKSGKVTYDYKIRYGTQAFREKCMKVLEDNVSPDIPSKELDFSTVEIVEEFASSYYCYIISSSRCELRNIGISSTTIKEKKFFESEDKFLQKDMELPEFSDGKSNRIITFKDLKVKNTLGRDVEINISITGQMPIFYYNEEYFPEDIDTYFIAQIYYKEDDKESYILNINKYFKTREELSININETITLKEEITELFFRIECEGNYDQYQYGTEGNIKIKLYQK